MPQEPVYGDRRRERDDRRRSQAQGTNVVPPSPALVRPGSKQRKIPAVLAPGQLTPQPVQAHIPIGVNRVNEQHPYAVATAVPYGFPQQNESIAYGRAPPVVPAINNMPAMRNDASYHDQDDTKPSFLRILTCRC